MDGSKGGGSRMEYIINYSTILYLYSRLFRLGYLPPSAIPSCPNKVERCFQAGQDLFLRTPFQYLFCMFSLFTSYSMYPFPYCGMFIACISWWIGRGITGYIRKYRKPRLNIEQYFTPFCRQKCPPVEKQAGFNQQFVFSQQSRIISFFTQLLKKTKTIDQGVWTNNEWVDLNLFGMCKYLEFIQIIKVNSIGAIISKGENEEN